jgi:hypothetical protein
MNEIAFVAAENLSQAQPTAQRIHRLGKTDLVEIGRQIAHFADAIAFANQQVIVLPINLAERTNYVADIGANAEVADSPYVDPDAHETSV